MNSISLSDFGSSAIRVFTYVCVCDAMSQPEQKSDKTLEQELEHMIDEIMERAPAPERTAESSSSNAPPAKKLRGPDFILA